MSRGRNGNLKSASATNEHELFAHVDRKRHPEEPLHTIDRGEDKSSGQEKILHCIIRSFQIDKVQPMGYLQIATETAAAATTTDDDDDDDDDDHDDDDPKIKYPRANS